MTTVNGYFTIPTAPAAPAAPPAPMMPTMPGAAGAWPTPVTVPVNNAPGYQTSGSADQYIQSAVSMAPYAAGVAPGKAAIGQVAEAKTFFAKAAKSKSMAAKANAGAAGRSALMGSVVSAVKSSVLVNGILSLAMNGYKVYKNQETMGQAAGEVSGDLMSAVVGGAAGGAASAAGGMLLAGVLGTGLPLTLVGIGLGIAGYMIADTMFRKTTFFTNVKTKVAQMFN